MARRWGGVGTEARGGRVIACERWGRGSTLGHRADRERRQHDLRRAGEGHSLFDGPLSYGRGEGCLLLHVRPFAYSNCAIHDEHVVPQWILRRYDMYNQRVTLPNGKTVRYDRFTVQCCEDCNSDLGSLVEEPVKDLLCDGYDSLVARMSETVRARLYCWCALLFLKMHLKDRDMRMEPDRRKGDAKIGDVHDWSTLHHVQSIARCPLAKVGLGHGAVGTLFFKRASCRPRTRDGTIRATFRSQPPRCSGSMIS